MLHSHSNNNSTNCQIAHKSEETRKRKAEKKEAEKSAAETSEKHLSSSFTIAPSEEMRFREETEEQL
ncbi:hypothetical protein Y032_0041g424 [Ancylostoma ceylanicum]|uniref:Uncharacterized protein n=1 Tax=Ancylostoma ceylanicum TaxID=53326 RepID=A0A016UH49_9BILA|nr:hypothetical protein Y032_0041g424 [Ancylostoma ceylanicum]